MKEVLKEKFLSELIPLERIFFLKKQMRLSGRRDIEPEKTFSTNATFLLSGNA